MLGAGLWIVLGAAIVVGSWQMDRLERFQIKPYEVPGLVPGLLGLLLMLLGAALLLRTRVRNTAERVEPASPSSGEAPERGYAPEHGLPVLALAMALSLVYALLLVGRGLPFWLATTLYVSAFIALLDGQRQRELGRAWAGIILRAALFGLTVGVVVSGLFQSVFLVRLP